MSRASFSFSSVASTLLLALAMTALSAGCGNVGSFTFTEESEEQTIDEQNGTPVDLLPFENPFKDISFKQELQQELEERDADGAKSVHLHALALRVTDSAKDGEDDEDNLNFIDSMRLFVDAEGLEKKEIAFQDPFPEGRERVELNVDDSVNLKPYIEEGITLTAEVEGRRPEDDPVSIQAVITLRVRVV